MENIVLAIQEIVKNWDKGAEYAEACMEQIKWLLSEEVVFDKII